MVGLPVATIADLLNAEPRGSSATGGVTRSAPAIAITSVTISASNDGVKGNRFVAPEVRLTCVRHRTPTQLLKPRQFGEGLLPGTKRPMTPGGVLRRFFLNASHKQGKPGIAAVLPVAVLAAPTARVDPTSAVGWSHLWIVIAYLRHLPVATIQKPCTRA
jgi:hypothetical protein